MTEPSRAVFISYASQDAEAATRICTALQAAGIEVWLDQSELRGGDAWDRQIRERIHDCRLFMALISANTEVRDEGYFRREWKLAADRTHDMAERKAFLLPVAIDATPERGASVPDKFHEVQWTRLPGGQTPPAFIDRVKLLLAPQPSTTSRPAPTAEPTASAKREQLRASSWSKAAIGAIVAVLAAASAYLLVQNPWVSKQPVPHQATATTGASPASANAALFAPPPHSIAVLPFVNMSGDKDQEYFSDGLTEELLNSLSRINELHVAGRTSSFYFKGKEADLGTIGRRLNVGAVLEGSVRRSAHTVRVTAQLINTVNGFHMWSQTYDRNMGDVLKLQTDIANAVASVLKVTLLGGGIDKMEVGGTRNPAAFDAYLRASTEYWQHKSERDLEQAIAGYREAVRLDPNFALAHAELSIALSGYAGGYATGAAVQSWLRQAREPALNAIGLAPELADGHLALAIFLWATLDLTGASEGFKRAAALGPGNGRVLQDYGEFAVYMGHTDAGLAALRRAVALDPLSVSYHATLIDGLRLARRYQDSLAALEDALSFYPDNRGLLLSGVESSYLLGDLQKVRSVCDSKLNEDYKQAAQFCLALVYHKLGRNADADTALNALKASVGNDGATAYAQLYAQWGNTAKALEWLETAFRMHDGDLAGLKVDPLLDPLRNEPRFQAILRELKFPE